MPDHSGAYPAQSRTDWFAERVTIRTDACPVGTILSQQRFRSETGKGGTKAAFYEGDARCGKMLSQVTRERSYGSSARIEATLREQHRGRQLQTQAADVALL